MWQVPVNLLLDNNLYFHTQNEIPVLKAIVIKVKIQVALHVMITLSKCLTSGEYIDILKSQIQTSSCARLQVHNELTGLGMPIDMVHPVITQVIEYIHFNSVFFYLSTNFR